MNRLIVGDRMFKKIKLNYSSLEPVISDINLDIHYNKHYGKYVNNLNKLYYHYIPLIALDFGKPVCNLTYYIDRKLYINNLFSIMNFDYANILYEEIK